MTTTDRKATTDWKSIRFTEYLDQVDAIMEARYAMESDHRQVAFIADRQEAGDSPRECVDWLNEEYELEVFRVRTPDRSRRLAELNDQFRTTFQGGQVVVSNGVFHQKATDIGVILTKVKEFNDFTPDNDPHGEHGFGVFDMPDVGKIYWKINYYDTNYYDAGQVHGSKDPANPEITTRVLTIMLAEEY